MFTFDPFDYAVHENPYPFYATLRDHHPAYWSAPAGCWVLSRHADVVAAMLQPTLFSSRAGNVINDSPEKLGRTVGSLDPPRHTRLRALVNEAFNRKQVTAEAPRIDAEARRLLVAALPGPFDLVRDVTSPLAGATMSALLGMDGADNARFKRLLDVSMHRDPTTRERTAEGNAAQADLLALVAAAVDRKRGRPGPDLISALLASPELTPDEVVWTARAVLGAGFESTSSFLANGTLALLDHPAQQALLRADPSLIDAAVEEMFRYESPAQRFARVLTADHALHGQTMRANDKVMVLYGAANRDPRAFPDPDRFDITRPTHGQPGRHLALGHGIHFCAGATLARLVARLFFTTLLTHPPLRRTTPTLQWLHSPTFRSLATLPLTTELATP